MLFPVVCDFSISESRCRLFSRDPDQLPISLIKTSVVIKYHEEKYGH